MHVTCHQAIPTTYFSTHATMPHHHIFTSSICSHLLSGDLITKCIFCTCMHATCHQCVSLTILFLGNIIAINQGITHG
ncbi:hypothetical protein BRADI_3g35523v3 [Brachypodium distachyon]|uniref:Uncharacterized protein n=1 Tax=Brachypodium distachyon TaxID=15368 RepID=A0A2K2D1B2_BRADI|nr:hypothetical protein BRADI_3g35523v3 [Brachypodium distachyon]